MKNSIISNIPKIFKGIMAIIYLFVGCLFLFSDTLFPGSIGPLRNILGVIIIIYGLLRIFQAYQSFFTKENEDNN